MTCMHDTQLTEYWNVTNLADLLEKLGLGYYLPRFTEQEVDLATFLTLDHADLVELGITTFGALRRMLAG